MLLNPLNIPYFLLNEGMITTEEVLCQDFTIHNNHSRNNNFIVNKYGSNPLFIKQVKTFDAEKTHTLTREATCYWLAANHPEFQCWKNIMPEYKTFDFNNHILTTRFYPSSSLYDHLMNHRQPEPNIASQIADLLSECHHPGLPTLLQQKYNRYFPTELPFVFKMAAEHYRSGWRQNETHTRELFELIQSDPVYTSRMEEVSHLWKASTIIHSDIKFQNLLIDAQGKIIIIDWETCDIGDPLWDVAAVFHMYLIAWVNGALTQDRSDDTGIMSITESYMQDQLQEFWNRYTNQAQWNHTGVENLLEKTLGFTALKLVHTSFEITTQSQKVDPYVAKVLQLGLNILKDPDAVIHELLKLKS